MGWPERGQLAAPGAAAPVRACAEHRREAAELAGGIFTDPAVSPDQCQVCHPAAPLTYSLERQLETDRALADANHHDEGTSYCTGLPDHGDELHPHPESARHLAPGVPAELDPLGQAAADLAPAGELLYSQSEYVRCSSTRHDGGRPHPMNAQCAYPHNAGHFRQLADQLADQPAPAEQSDAGARADEIAAARDLQELAAHNLAAVTEDLIQARQAVAEAEQECDQAAAALARVDPDAPPLRTVADIRAEAIRQAAEYDRLADGMLSGQGRATMAAAAVAMTSIVCFIDGES